MTRSFESFPGQIISNNQSQTTTTTTDTPPRFGSVFTDTISTNFTFAACLLVKDDNRRLPEWLAYHFTVLPLRRLILAGDAYSVTSPQHILQEFQNEIGLNTTIWNDDDYMFNDYDRKKWAVYGKVDVNGDPFTAKQIYDAHLWRQQVFLTRCVQQLWREGRSWIILVDSDEFVTFNSYRPDVEGAPEFCFERAKLPGRRRRRVNSTALEECHSQYKRDMENGVMARGLLPPSLDNSTIAEFIEKNRERVGAWSIRSCIVIPRLMFGGTDSPPTEELQALYNKYPELSNDTFHTLRYRQHGKVQANTPGKSIIDISQIDPSRRFINNPHRVFGNDCQSGPIAKYSLSLFRANHYTGGLDDFIRQGADFTHTEEQYKKRNSFGIGGESGEMISWFDAFAEKVGSDRALYLTQTLKREATEEYRKIMKQMENENATELLLPRPFIPSEAYLEEHRKKLNERFEAYKQRMTSSS